MPTQRQRLEAALDRYSDELKAAFLAAIDDIRSRAEIGRVIAALEAGNVEAALRAIHIDPAAFRAFERVLGLAYNAGGEALILSLPVIRDLSGDRVGIRFDPGDRRAAERLAHHAGNLITGITEDARASVRAALSEGMAAGRGARSVALDIVGRVNRATGKREGGILGLTGQQAGFVSTARQELASGDAEAMRHYLTRTARDRRFDRTVSAAIRDGKSLTAETVTRVTDRYSARLEDLRGEVVARTEGARAVQEGADEAMRQTVNDAGIDEQLVERTWRATHDHRTRDSHAAMDGQAVRGFETPFISPSGASLLYPLDPSAPVGEIINCRCTVTTRILRPGE